ncbi:MAG: GGDEF domain-containing protein [Lachnospiraceae bacterium]|nr:GGDEF domain-containing protein [Lachnospiraceae bacterium]
MKNGISHRIVHLWLIIIIIIFSGTVVFATIRMTDNFLDITEASDQSSELQKAAHELMNASDYLTEQVQRFTINGDICFMEQYFTEAFESRRREEAISKMAMDSRTDAALSQLQVAMDNSVELMELEYYAMRLVIEAKGYTDYPEILDSVTLKEEDKALSDQEKIRLATELVLSDEYYEQKDRIRKGMQDSLDELDKRAKSIEESELASLKRELRIIHIAILIEAILIFYLIWLTTKLSIEPILKAVGQIKEDLPISEDGSNEFRYLANAYNKMYEKNKSSFENLSFKVSHDELTGAYNRAGYDLLLSSIELDSTYMMLFDVDDFKQFNDTYGHETGDKILVKVVTVLKRVFRDDDCICRIGGDEFVVLLRHSGNIQNSLIKAKLEQINKDLRNTDDGLPAVSISVGIMNGKDVTDAKQFFEMTDKAMYESKKQGKGTYTFQS